MRVTFHSGFQAVLLAAALALGACSSDGGKSESAVVCPAAGVLDHAGSATKFRSGAGRDLTDVTWRVRITDVAATCRLGKDETGIVDMRIGLRVERGPAEGGGAVPVTYFVAIIGPDGQVLSREAFQVDFDIPAGRSGATATEELALKIPRPGGAPLADYRVVAALQLTPEELDYNRQNRVP